MKRNLQMKKKFTKEKFYTSEMKEKIKRRINCNNDTFTDIFDLFQRLDKR